MSTLHADSITKRFAAPAAGAAQRDAPATSSGLDILRGVNLSLSAGECAIIMGPSGSGKSTLLNILGTLDQPTSGALRLAGDDPFALDEPELAAFRNRRIGFIFQEHHLLPQCTVMENVLIPTLAQRDNPDRSDRARALLKRVGLADRVHHRPAELSGGERQRVAIARALINDPMLVLADEPTGNLDRTTADELAALLAEIHGASGPEAGAGNILVLVTHSERLAARVPGNTYELDDGVLSPLESAANPSDP